MTIRFTQTEKWDDKWFRQLSPNAKVLYWYIWDKCNIAGFWEIDLDAAAFHTKISKRGLQGALKELERGFDTNKNYLWLRRFLYHQKNLPLNPENPAHKGILRLIEEYKSIFPNVLEKLEEQTIRKTEEGACKGLSSPISISNSNSNSKSNSKSKSKSKFIAPTLEEFEQYIQKEKLNLNAESLWKGYSDGGWIDTQGKPVRNWKLKLRTLNNYGQQTTSTDPGKSAQRPKTLRDMGAIEQRPGEFVR